MVDEILDGPLVGKKSPRPFEGFPDPETKRRAKKMTPSPKAIVKAPYPMKHVKTWLVSQLLCRAGMSGWMRVASSGESEA